MPVIISLLRGVNVTGHNQIKMDVLRALYESLKFTGCQTYINSGNVVFCTRERNLTALPERVEKAIERKFGFRPSVIHRTADELRDVVARNPFARRRDIHPGKLLVGFLARDPDAEACAKLRAINTGPEEVHFAPRELYLYFPNGVGRADLPWSTIDRAMKVPITGRNWNTVTKLLAIAEQLESAR
ncbi:MAG TPA: DUF1697 domain-containing protein [Candidatus Acidoferrales bacterium]|nr:DUF1697 domain-containing protein [Candidatus Acidoferrales bacterium]